MQQQGSSFWRNFLLIGGIILILSMGAYVFISVKYPSFDWRAIWKTAMWAGILFAVVFIGVYVYNKTKKKESPYGYEKPKQPVDTNIAIKIWKQCYYIDNEIPVRTDVKTKEHSPINPDAIIIHTRKRFSDKSTGSRFYGFDAEINEGRFIGILHVILSIDQGEEYIRNNFDERMEVHQSFLTTKPDFNLYPLDSPKTAEDRFNLMRIDMLSEGLSEKEIESKLAPFIKTTKQPQVVIQTGKRKPVITTPEAGSDIPAEYTASEDEQETSAIDEDIAEYREKRQYAT